MIRESSAFPYGHSPQPPHSMTRINITSPISPINPPTSLDTLPALVFTSKGPHIPPFAPLKLAQFSHTAAETLSLIWQYDPQPEVSFLAPGKPES